MSKNPVSGSSLRAKFLLPLIAGGVTVAVIGSWIAVQTVTRSFDRVQLVEAQQLASAVNHSAMVAESLHALQHVIREVVDDSPQVRAILVARGRPSEVVAASRPEWVGLRVDALPDRHLAEELSRELAAGEGGYHYEPDGLDFVYLGRLAARPSSASAQFGRPADLHERDAHATPAVLRPAAGGEGAILLLIDRGPARAAAAAVLWRLNASIFAAVCVMVLLAHVLMSRTVLLPLDALRGAMQRRREGARAERVRIGSRDEIGLVAASFNQMLDAIERNEDNLSQLSMAVQQSPASVMITDTQGNIEYVNPKFVEVTGYSAQEVLGKNPRLLKSDNTPAERYEELWRTITAGREWRGELSNRKKSGELFWEYASISPIKNRGGAITHYIAVKEDVTTRKEYEARLITQANYDELTGLPNRLLVMDRLTQAMAYTRRKGGLVAVLFMDLDGFKKINDTLGHDAGDRLLREAAQRFGAALRETDTVARFGGDEFVVVLPELKDPFEAERVAEKLLEACSTPYTVAGQSVCVTVSIGITLYPSDETDPQLLLRNADAAMYHAKDGGRNAYCFFEPAMNAKAKELLEMEGELRNAIERKELAVHYQPLLDAASGMIRGAEALVRWNSARYGAVAPDKFIPLAEETGLILAIGEWVLREACAAAAGWMRDCGEELSISVNVSVRQFQKGDLAKRVAEILRETGLPPRCLQLEVTETVLMEASDKTETAMHSLREMGVRFAIDDFGTGFSSLGNLRKFRFDALKIDRSFLRSVTHSRDDAALVDASIHIAKTMFMSVVAEGIETDEQLQHIRARGCDYYQGWLCSPAVPPSEFVQLLRGADGSNA